MPRTVNGYRRLPGRDASLLHRSELWVGADHLLRVERQGVTETYRRFHFDDIQAVVVRPTRQWVAEAVVSGTLAGLFSVTALFSQAVWSWFWLGLTGLVLPFAVVTVVRGATVECYLKTAVQTDRLTSLKRVRTARRFLAIVRPLIDQAQGTWAPAEFQQRLQTLAAPTTAEPPVLAAPRRLAAARLVRHSRGRLHFGLCLLLLADAAHSGVELFYEHQILDTIGLGLFLALGGLCLATLIRQVHTDLPGGLKRLVWITLAYYLVLTMVGIGYAISRLVARMPGELTAISEENDVFAFALTGVALLGSLALASSGLLMLRRWWQTGRPAPPELSAPVATEPEPDQDQTPNDKRQIPNKSQ